MHSTGRNLSVTFDLFCHPDWILIAWIGAFFNGVFLLALALSIFLQSIERFVHVEPVHSPAMILIVGCVGLSLNIISAIVVHGE